MAAYMIADVLPADPSGYRESGYLEAAVRTATANGGEYLIRGGDITVLEGNWEPGRVVVIKFPSMADLRVWYDSNEYQEWAAIRRQYVPDSKLIAVQGA